MLRRTMARSDLERCSWCGDNPLYLDYHDREWGVPLRGDRALFELLTLEGAQAGLSWITILKKRDGYRAAFARFDPETVARYTARDVRRLLSDAGIVRNRLKVESTIANAKAVLALEEQGSLRWADHLLCLHAGRGPRQRPRPGVLPPRAGQAPDAVSRAQNAALD